MRASSLELGPLGQGGLRSERDLGIGEDGSMMEGSSKQKLTLRKLNVEDMVLDLCVFRTEGSPEKARGGRDSGMDSETCECIRKSSW